jgi:hypothetical protein
MQVHRFVEQMHDREGDWLVSPIDDHPDMLVREVDLGRDQVIIGKVGVGRRTEYGGGPLYQGECREVIRARASDGNGFTHWRCSAGCLSA